MKKGEETIKLDNQPEEGIEPEEEGTRLVQTIIDEHGIVKSMTYKNVKTGEEIVETF